MSGKYALIIGNTEYADPKLAKLSAPGKDAEGFAEVLKAPDLAAFDEVITLINQTSYDGRRAIAQFLTNKKSGDLLILYFSGHGIRDEQGRLFLATKDTDNTILDATAIPSDFVTRAMDNCRSKRQVLILDCCNSGAFAYGTKGSAGASMGTGSAFEGNGYGHVVLTATDSTQFAYEGDQIIGAATSNSLFTHFLIKGLQGEADSDGDGMISVDELYDYASQKIHELTPKQNPEKFVYHQQERMILTTRVRPETVKPVPLERELQEALGSEINFVRKAAVEQLGHVVNSANRGQALMAEQTLNKVADTDDSLTIRNFARQLLDAHHTNEGVQPAAVQTESPKPEEPPAIKPEPAVKQPEANSVPTQMTPKPYQPEQPQAPGETNGVSFTITSSAMSMLFDREIQVWLDGVLIGRGSFIKGVNVQVHATEGRHIISLNRNGGNPSLLINAEKNKSYRVDLNYSRISGGFSPTCKEIGR